MSDQTNVEKGLPLESGIPVGHIIGVILKFKDGVLIDVVGASNSPEHAYLVALALGDNDKTPGITYDSKAVKSYSEKAI
jgi:hypothetical protein